MSRPFILYVHDLRGSGVVTNAIALARKLGAERETILCAGFDQGLNRAADVSPARLVVLFEGAEPEEARIVAAKRLKSLIRNSGARLVMSMGNYGHRTVFRATWLSRTRAVYRISNEVGRAKADRRKNLKRLRWHRRLLWFGAHVVVVGRALAEQSLFAAAIRLGRATYIPNGVDIDRARQLANAPAPHPWLTGDGPPVVLAIGRIHPQKNLEGLIGGAALALQRRPLRLIIVGTGEAALQGQLEAHAAALGMGDALCFAGETDNVFSWLARARLFALTSHWEGSSTALLEAMAIGVPIVASRQAGDAADVLGQGDFGELVDADETESIASGILRQLEDPIRPRDRVEAYRLERTHQRYIELLRAL